jgi:hypothetical protein
LSQASRSRAGLEQAAATATTNNERHDTTQQTGTKQTDDNKTGDGKATGTDNRRQHSEKQKQQNRKSRRKAKLQHSTYSAGADGGGRYRRAATDTSLGVSYTRRQERHRPQPGWHAGHIFTRLA